MALLSPVCDSDRVEAPGAWTATPNLKLPYIMAAQAQKHVTHNEAIRALDALVQLGVLDRDLATPPADGTATSCRRPTGAWSRQAGKVVAWQDGAWAFYAARQGWTARVADESKTYSTTARAGSFCRRAARAAACR